jgi:hypothetical protein
MKKFTSLLLFTMAIALTANAQIKAECISGNCANGRGIFKNSNGSVYDGEFVDSMKNGKGVIVWQSGDKYIGDFKANYITGKGTLIYKDGRSYEGDFFQNQFEGTGMLVYSDGSKYNGDWKAGKRNGKGKYTSANNFEYEGDFVNDLYDGKGIMSWTRGSQWQGDKYIGDFKKGQRSGKGKYVFANGTIEEGDFENGKFINPLSKPWTCISGDCQNGIGTYNYSSENETYTGQFKNGYANGEGTYKNRDGIYKGKVFRQDRDGFGTFTDLNGYSYTGNWKYNKIVYGTFDNGKGTTYTGQFKEGLSKLVDYDGEGTEIDWVHMGKIIKGKRENGKPVGKWVEIYPNGFYKETTYKNYSVSNEKYFDNKNNIITGQEFDAKVVYQICAAGNCYSGIGICEYDRRKHFYIGYWVNGKKEGFVADFETSSKYYYGIWKADTLVRKIDDKEAEKYLTENAKLFLSLLNSNRTFAAAASLIENCTVSTCLSGDCKNGFATWKDCKGNSYTGHFANGKFHERGKLSLAAGDVYDGDWVNNVKQGKGRYTWYGGGYYDGDWVNNTKEGKGRYVAANGDVYNGDWVNDVKQGKGEMTWQQKEYYIGDWVNGIRQGYGRSRDTEGRIREGNWVNDKFVITETQRQINEVSKYQISVLEKEISETRTRMINIPSPNDPIQKKEYDRVRENMQQGINEALRLIQTLTLQIIE